MLFSHFKLFREKCVFKRDGFSCFVLGIREPNRHGFKTPAFRRYYVKKVFAREKYKKTALFFGMRFF